MGGGGAVLADEVTGELLLLLCINLVHFKKDTMTCCLRNVLPFLSLIFCCRVTANGHDKTIIPVTKNASPEARALLQFFYAISGKYILTGQHNYPNVKDRNTQFAVSYTGKTPVVFSTDWGFERAGNTDSYLARQDIVNEAIRQNKLGSLITICWHAVPPTADEPVTFQPKPGADSSKLASVQGKLLDQQFKDVLTPGTALYKHWCQQVDSIAVYLMKLQDAHVPVLWRPYHEMNGDWFWWGGRQGTYSTIRVYRQLFDRLVNHHKLNNLIWIWNVDRPSTPARKFTNFYVGSDVFDIASLDVYGNDFKQSYYDSLLVLAKGKPILLGEVGNPPDPEVLKRQPLWTYYVIWAGMVRNTLKKQYDRLLNDSHVLSLEDAAYRAAIAPYRLVAGLSPLAPVVARSNHFSGTWIFDEEKSILENAGTTGLASQLEVALHERVLDVKRTMLSEWGDPTVRSEELTLDGRAKEVKAPFGNRPRLVTARSSAVGDTLFVDAKMTFLNGGLPTEWTTSETWTLQQGGKSLSIVQSTTTSRGKSTIRAIYDRR